MARRGIHRLTERKIARVTRRGLHGDGGGLYLQVSPTATKSWIFRYEHAGRAHLMGLGSLDVVNVEEARDEALKLRKLRHTGVDPLDHRRAERAKAALAAASTMTFIDAARGYIAAHRAGWKSGTHATQWIMTLLGETLEGEKTANNYCAKLHPVPVQSIDHNLVLQVIEPLWHDKPETASRLRGRIEQVLGWATVKGYRSGDNPARWRGHLDKLLPAVGKVRDVKHHAALPHAELPAFLPKLRAEDSTAARALEFLILTRRAHRRHYRCGSRGQAADAVAAPRPRIENVDHSENQKRRGASSATLRLSVCCARNHAHPPSARRRRCAGVSRPSDRPATFGKHDAQAGEARQRAR